MKKTILITGATDGIGLSAAQSLAAKGHDLLVHGRNPSKLASVHQQLTSQFGSNISVKTYCADFSNLPQVDKMADNIIEENSHLDVLINNAGILKAFNPITKVGLDVRFVVNTLAPYHLLKRLEKFIRASGRVINVSSAAQAPVNLKALTGDVNLGGAMEAYSQSKLANTMWSIAYASRPDAPVIISLNPGSLLATKMVTEAFGIDGKDLTIGSDIICQAALDESFATKTGQYYDNDVGRFASPHPDVNDSGKVTALFTTMEQLIATNL
mmetsp:Transcript_1705/g.2343  ORF Transcript_1705/g.2343 Transcript_1705/m.2343 type:complete len:269 (+) Transcript_1705:131-937(+)